MDAPTLETIKDLTDLTLDDLDWTEEKLQTTLDRALRDVLSWTGHTLDDIPADLEITAVEAIQRTFEYNIVRTSEDVLETIGDFDLIQNFSVQGYSETRRSPDDAMKAKMIVEWPLLNQLLWDLSTDERKDLWREEWGVLTPAFAITEVEWLGSEWWPAGLFDPGA